MTARKITIQIDEKILDEALKSTNEGITETIRQGLQLLAARKAYQGALELKGKFKLKVDVKKLREDR